MIRFLAGIASALVAVLVGTYVYLHFGLMDLSAARPLGKVEGFFVHGMLDRWAERKAPRGGNPVPVTDANLIEGVKLYERHCAGCHGSPRDPASRVGHALYPDAPQFMKDPPTDMSEGMTYVIAKQGVARTGMPAWREILSDEELWKLTMFLKRMDKLPPAVEREWRHLPPGAPLAPAPTGAPRRPPDAEEH